MPAWVRTYDDNINNGIKSDTVHIGGYKFAVDEDSRARDGLLIGMSGYIGACMSYAEGGTVQLSGGAAWRKAAHEDIIRRSALAPFAQTIICAAGLGRRLVWVLLGSRTKVRLSGRYSKASASGTTSKHRWDCMNCLCPSATRSTMTTKCFQRASAPRPSSRT